MLHWVEVFFFIGLTITSSRTPRDSLSAKEPTMSPHTPIRPSSANCGKMARAKSCPRDWITNYFDAPTIVLESPVSDTKPKTPPHAQNDEVVPAQQPPPRPSSSKTSDTRASKTSRSSSGKIRHKVMRYAY